MCGKFCVKIFSEKGRAICTTFFYKKTPPHVPYSAHNRAISLSELSLVRSWAVGSYDFGMKKQ